jgi:hypothetical protein
MAPTASTKRPLRGVAHLWRAESYGRPTPASGAGVFSLGSPKLPPALGGGFPTAWQGARPTGQSTNEAFLVCLAMVSGAAGLVHLAAAFWHFDESGLHGAFFIGTGLMQLAAAGLLTYRSSGWILIATAAGNAVILAIWVMSRTMGIPIGPDSWTPEPVGIADAVASLFELVLVIGSPLMLSSSSWLLLADSVTQASSGHSSPAGSTANLTRAVLVPAASAVVVLTGLALFSSGPVEHSHAHGAAGSTEDHGRVSGAVNSAGPAPMPTTPAPIVQPPAAAEPSPPAATAEPIPPTAPAPLQQQDSPPSVEASNESVGHDHDGDGHQGHE